MRSVSIASDGSSLVAGNHKVSARPSFSLRLFRSVADQSLCPLSLGAFYPRIPTSSSRLLPHHSALPRSIALRDQQGIVYVWNIQPGLTFTSLQPKTKFQAHSRYLIKVLISPDTKSVLPLSSLPSPFPLPSPLPLLLANHLPSLETSPPVQPTRPSRSGPPTTLLQPRVTGVGRARPTLPRRTRSTRSCRVISGGCGIWPTALIRLIWCRVSIWEMGLMSEPKVEDS
jgi:hypothetical protein